jgi:hypothetical protein
VRRDGIRIDREGDVDLTNRRRVIAFLMQDDAQEVQAVKVIWLRQDDLAVGGLSIRQATVAMARHRFGERRRDIERAFRGGLPEGFLLPRPHGFAPPSDLGGILTAESN